MYIFRVKWWFSKYKLKDDHSKTKVIGFRSYSLFFQHFRREIGWTTTESFGEIVLSLLAKPEIYKHYMAIST